MRYVADLEACAALKLQCRFESISDSAVTQIVCDIFDRVQTDGDRAIIELTKDFDGISFSSAENFRISQAVLDGSLASLDQGMRVALEQAAQNIRQFHSLQRPSPVVWEQPGKRIELRQDPIQRVALYVSGGHTAYPSSVLMNAIPAIVAGVEEIVVFTPPTLELKQLEAVYATCALLGLTEVYSVGGAQAIAAATIGTESIAPCDLITGPGNQFVTEAKRQSMDRVKIDMLAGPSELLIVADGTANPEFVASDLLAHAEHNPQTGLFLVLIGSELEVEVLFKQINDSIRDLLTIDSSQNAALSIQNLLTLGCPDASLAASLSNRIAPEHLSLQFSDARQMSGRFVTAGSIFIGSYTPKAVADFAAGANHVLPTTGTSRFASALGVSTFLKATQIVEYTAEALEKDGFASMVLAQYERLPYHAQSLGLRLQSTSSPSLRLSFNKNFEAYWLDKALVESFTDQLSELARTYPTAGYARLEAQLNTALSNLFPNKGPLPKLVLGNGSDEILDVLLRALVPPNGKVALLDPSFSEYGRLISINSLIEKRIPSQPETGWYDAEELLKSLVNASSDCQVILLCNPNNPTGQLFSPQWVERLVSQVPKDCLIILDEAFMEFSEEQDDVPWIAPSASNVIQVRTLSKACGAAGLRLGYALLSAEYAQSIKPYLAPYRLSNPTAALALKALECLSTTEGRQTFISNRSALTDCKRQFANSLNLDHLEERGGNFLWLKLSPLQRQAVDNDFLKIKLFNGVFNNFARITMGNPLQMSWLTSTLLQGAINDATTLIHLA